VSDIHSGNRVRVTKGRLMGRKGMVVEIIDNSARLHLTKFGESEIVPLDSLRREYRHDEQAPPGASLTISARRRIRERKRYGLKP
jgi:hypothetical protein